MIKTIEYINTYATCNFPLVSGYYKMLHTCDGDLLLSGISKHPLNFPHSFPHIRCTAIDVPDETTRRIANEQ